MDFDGIYDKALKEGQEKHPDAHASHHHSFASGVVYLMGGVSMGIGPTVRIHAVSWALSGKNGKQALAETNIGQVVIQYPDGSLPLPGSWSYEDAVFFAEPLCYGELTELHQRCYKFEACFDDAPEDIEALKKL